MFERYTEAARKVIFFSKVKADSFGSHYIETEHLLLGLLHEPAAVSEFLASDTSVETIQREISEHIHIREPIPPGTDRPLSQAGKRVLRRAMEEADALGHQEIGPGHLLLGLLREEGCLAARILDGHGLRAPALREKLSFRQKRPGQPP